MAAQVDNPIAGLLADLHRRGLVETAPVVLGRDCGRTPISDGQSRDGGAHRGGGFKAVEDPVHINDVHATILGLLALDHRKLAFFFQGRTFRLTGGARDPGGSA
jgi:hypothetical protein